MKEPLSHFARPWWRKKYGCHRAVCMAKKARRHQRFVRLSIRIANAVAQLNDFLYDFDTALAEADVEITNPERLLAVCHTALLKEGA